VLPSLADPVFPSCVYYNDWYCCSYYYCRHYLLLLLALLLQAMVRILRDRREIQFIVLGAIHAMAADRPHMFRPYLREFFVKAADPLFCSTIKLDIICSLAAANSDSADSSSGVSAHHDADACSAVLGELQSYVRHGDKTFVKAAVRAVARIAAAHPEAAGRCLRGLMTLAAGSSAPAVAGEAICAARQLLQRACSTSSSSSSKGTNGGSGSSSTTTAAAAAVAGIDNVAAVLRQLVRMLVRSLEELESSSSSKRKKQTAGYEMVPEAQASIVWLAGEYTHLLLPVAPDLLRVLANCFAQCSSEVRKLLYAHTLHSIYKHANSSLAIVKVLRAVYNL
jgi:vesicle coat complex subunit